MKSWESPRRGRRRNHKSKSASARLRQLKKQRQQLHKKLKAHPHLQQKASGQQPEAFALGTGKPHTQIIEVPPETESTLYKIQLNSLIIKSIN